MDDLQKAAQLLKHLSVTDRTQILSQLDAAQRTALEAEIANVSEVSQSELAGIVAEYQTWLRQMQSLENDHEPATRSDDVRFLTDSRDHVRLAELLASEPETIQSAVLCHIEEQTAREIFHALSQDQQAELVQRLPEQRALSPLVWDELSQCLNEAKTSEKTPDKRGQQLLSRLIAGTEPDVVSVGQLIPAEQELLERMKR